MREISYVVAFFGAVSLLASAAAWWTVVSETEEEPTGGRVGIHLHRVKSAATLTAIAFGLSGVAAVLAIVGWLAKTFR